jgi:vancomycin resistance protein VanK
VPAPLPEPTALTVRTITVEQHKAFVDGQPWVSFLQTPAWGPLKSEWQRESVGWFRDGVDEPVGVGLVLQRPVPRLRRFTFAYLPEGPVIDWSAPTLADWLTPLTAYLKERGAFGVRIGPMAEVARWSAEQIKEGIADPAVKRLRDVEPRHRDAAGEQVAAELTRLGWRSQAVQDGFGPGQPQYNFEVPLVTTGPDGERVRRTEDDVLRGMNQQWRRNIKKAAKAGVVVSTVDLTTPPAELEAAIADFHELYVHTAERDGFTARGLSYFKRMFDSLSAEDPDRIKLFLARHEGDLVAASIMVRVGVHTWYAYGASSSEKRDVRGSNAMQWAMIQNAIALGADVYDMRGITNTLDTEDSEVGLIQFKVGTGGEAVEYVGEWDLPLNRLLYKAFDLYTRPR